MQAEFWLQRWREGRIGFHRDAPMPLLVQHWPALELPRGSRVLVPLCGKALDMPWLAEQGYRVLGVELSPLAIGQFFDEQGLKPEKHESALGIHHVAGNIEVIQGDATMLDETTLLSCDAVYDRAAIIALPPAMREHYAETVYGRLRPGCRTLMLTLEYPQAEMDGPPFSVDVDNVNRLLARNWQVEVLDRSDILASQPGFQRAGLTSLHANVFRLERH
ncbi:MAG TPA: thiopurine S-methyltransferase [Rhodanobacteraceae bacterium]|nr:thiopurine S-methyltransferase [Rhodanobacteraceae bacterium]